MADTHKQWLEKLEAESRAKQELFMNDIAAKLRHPRMTQPPQHPYRGAPDFWKAFEWPEEERIKEFTDNFLSVGGHVARLQTMDEAKEYIVQKAQEMSAKYVVRQNQPELDALDLEEALTDSQVSVWNTDPEQYWRARAAEADFGIVIADHAVAYTGSVTVLSAENKGRSVSLLPTVLIIIIPVERLKTRLGEVLETFDQAGRDQLPAGIHFISGPSRSSDIENDLTIGVHGPGIVYALLVG
ncbi:LutC/YkgG family protein [Paenibacillus prosopidis]|uniref:L-lactate dehydrogenase complex protein LldG n=1 Tax=Paenibacillus prosopidis TaxID=630520 RepID=A0A368VU46_9BACL|nr:LUD domain-containing protein [Paenibacillus prosopidis]RCW45554.1 L-lactate dehydrogenase complex protein LldG [Paenibacillus prosopidis]